MDTSRFVLYRNLEHQDLFDSMAMLLDEEGPAQMDGYACANRLLELAAKYGFEGNLWHCFWRTVWQPMKTPTVQPAR